MSKNKILHQIKDMFDYHLDHLVIDKSFIKLLGNLRNSFMTKNEEHLEFFSGNLIGVNIVRYTPSDRADWFDLVLEVNESDLKPDLKKIETIDSSWVRANDLINLSAIYVMYKIHNSKLSPKDKEQGLMDVCLLLQYKFLSSLLYNFFEFRSNKDIARSTYEALSRKFDLKQQGSWQALLVYRSKNIIDRNGIFFKTYSTMENDQLVINMITGVQDSLRKIVKKQKDVFDRVRNDNLKISTTSTVVVFEGEKDIMERVKDHTSYTEYLKDIIIDKPTFIRRELLDIVIDLMHTVNEQYLIDALEYCSNNYGKGGDKNIEKLLDIILLHTYRFLYESEGAMVNTMDYSQLLLKLKNLYTASRMSDEQLLDMRKLTDKIVKKAVSSKSKNAMSSARNALQLYIVIRALSRDYYTK